MRNLRFHDSILRHPFSGYWLYLFINVSGRLSIFQLNMMTSFQVSGFWCQECEPLKLFMNFTKMVQLLVGAASSRD
jgi:hypothetical protein